MGPVLNCLDYDQIILDSKGRRGVKDGKEFPISDKEWRKANPEHKDSGCKECSFVADIETLFLYLIPRDLKEKATTKPLFAGNFTMPSWVGHSGFYLFKCKKCGSVGLDYPHGYTGHGLLFLRCGGCGETLPLEVKTESDIYKRENIHIPQGDKKWNPWNVGLVLLALWTLGIFFFTHPNWRPF